MKVRLVKPWGNLAAGSRYYPAGMVLDVQDNVGEMLLRRGRAVKVRKRKPKAEAPADGT